MGVPYPGLGLIGQRIALAQKVRGDEHVLVGGNGMGKAAHRLIGAEAIGRAGVRQKIGADAQGRKVRRRPNAADRAIAEFPHRALPGAGVGIGHLARADGGHPLVLKGRKQRRHAVVAGGQGVLGQQHREGRFAGAQGHVPGAAVVEVPPGDFRHPHPLVGPRQPGRAVVGLGIDDPDDLGRQRLPLQRPDQRINRPGGVQRGHNGRIARGAFQGAHEIIPPASALQIYCCIITLTYGIRYPFWVKENRRGRRDCGDTGGDEDIAPTRKGG